MRNNLIVLLSNVRFSANLDIDMLGVRVPNEKRFFIDNMLFSVDFANESSDKLREFEFEYQKLKDKVAILLENIEDLHMTPTDHFRRIKEKRDEFKVEIDKIRTVLEEKIKEKRKLEQLMQDLITCENEKTQLDLKKFKPTTEEYWEDVSTDPVYNTRCITCKSNCHLKCSLDETTVQGADIFLNCAAMNGEFCKVCTHKFDQHVHLRAKYEKHTRTKQVIDASIAGQINSQADLIKNKQAIKNDIAKREAKLEQDVVNAKNKVFDLLNKLQSYCSDFNYVKELELTKSLLESRIEYLQSEFSRTKQKTYRDDMEAAMKSKNIIEDMIRIVFNGVFRSKPN